MHTKTGKCSAWTMANGNLTQQQKQNIPQSWQKSWLPLSWTNCCPLEKFDINDDIGDHAAKVGSVHQPRRTRGPLIFVGVQKRRS